MPPPEAKQVRLVIDDSAVKGSEIGRGGAAKYLVLAAVTVTVGLLLGFAVGSTLDRRRQYNNVIHDGKEIYNVVRESAVTAEKADKQLKAALKRSTPGPTNEAAVAYEAIEALRALKKPFDAGAFSRRWYKAFRPATVDDLFQYHNNVQVLWERFERLSASTLTQNRREVLDKAAKSIDALARQQYGVVTTRAGDTYVGGLVYVSIPPVTGKTGAAKKKDQGPPAVKVSSRLGGRTVDRYPFLGHLDFPEKPDKYVILLDKARSMGILGASADAFARYRAEVSELAGLMQETIEIQGRLLTELGKVAALKEQWTF
ncbi:MAG: hypothetical protein MJD61_06235 [Proteobacteria bacterium]|nr:hypothetical protein [Pseudomonadota bacterium]